MRLDFNTCYRAVVARDPRFDGRFFTGVTSTGIYCRPICPARTPARGNMRFYPHAGAAEAAGFRACRRCRPEASPGSPDWNARADLAARAVRLITDGYVDEHGIDGLARRLAVTPRHLHRLLVAELGTGPLALARTARLQTARRLLAETSLPVTEIAFASGFSSIRQFNASFQESYGQPPSALRAGRRAASTRGTGPRGAVTRVGGMHTSVTLAGDIRVTGGQDGRGRAGRARTLGSRTVPGLLADPDAAGTWLSLRLACREPFDAESMLGFLAVRAIPGVEHVTADRYARTIRTSAGSGVIELIPRPTGADAAASSSGAARNGRPGQGQVLLRVRLAGLGGVGQVVSRCRQLFDLDADPAAIGTALASDDVIAPLVRARPGLRVPGAYDGFELAVRAVLGQQVSVAAARTFAGRLAAQHGIPLEPAGAAPPDTTGDTGSGPSRPAGPAGPTGGLSTFFPGAAELVDADLSGLGLTTSRQVTLRALAEATATGRLALDPGADPEETAARLGELPGIGPWTIGYILMRAVHDPDAYPESDLGLRRALRQLDCPPAHAVNWRPWRAYAALHLWTWAASSGTPAAAGPAPAAAGPAPARPGRLARAAAGPPGQAARPGIAT